MSGPLRHAFDSPAAKRRYVRQLFATIADRYDLITVLLSYGRDRSWKRLMVDHALDPDRLDRDAAGARALDLACGTGDIAAALAARGASVVGLDITPRMIQIAVDKSDNRSGRCTFLVGDMMTLPFPDGRFDLVTVGYGLRNVPGLDGALREIARVLRPGGQLVSLDFDRPVSRIVRAAYLSYLAVVGSIFGAVLHGDPNTYRYIAESLRRYPGSAGVAALMRDLGFSGVGHLPLLGGLMAITYGRK